MARIRGVLTRVTTGRRVAATDVAALRTPAQVQPPAWPIPRKTLDAAGAAWRDTRIDSGNWLQLFVSHDDLQVVRLAIVVDDFDVVAVGVEHKRGVVAVVIAGALTRLAVAAVSGRGRVGVEAAYVVVFA